MSDRNFGQVGLVLAALLSAPLSAQTLPPLIPAGNVPSSSVSSTQVAQNFSLKEAAQAALLKNPEVQLRWHAFREASEEIGVARGGFFPKVDFSAGVGKQKTVQQSAGIDSTYHGNERTLTLRQMLFDGFSTSSEVKRLGKAKLVRYFELLDASENVALEAGRAYLDVVRYRSQVFLAEDNYIQHQMAYEQLKQRAESGVGKRVDVEQAASRLALADVNLTTAYANLHDVTARYLRIVGEQPPKVMFAPAQLAKALPLSVDSALGVALKHNPALRASLENIEASQYDIEARRAAYMPKLDLVARRDDYSNYQNGGAREDSRIELRLNYNLFNGGSDLARSGQYRERKNMALDQREKACRDMRQTLSIAYNDTLRLNDQLSYISLQVGLVEKTRTAYRDQFNIGQRTLLDLLNTQNEYFDARRSQVNADADLAIAYMRSYTSMGRLLETLGLKRVDAENNPDEGDLAPVDLAQLCPISTPLDTTLDREVLNRKAREMIDNSDSSFIGNRSQPAAAAPVSEALVASAAEQPARNSSLENEIIRRMNDWGVAWASREIKNYLDFYAPDFVPENSLSRAAWALQREQKITRAKDIRIEIQNLVVRSTGPDTVIAEFKQIYSSNMFNDTTDKALEWRKVDGQWRIERETIGREVKGL